ncbi:MAG: patatin-like phospholipase family protein [Alphaproteobacteria bacterium]|nr:patatin-like phospholipase family protein [Alphaproteobacteria bacterium]
MVKPGRDFIKRYLPSDDDGFEKAMRVSNEQLVEAEIQLIAKRRDALGIRPITPTENGEANVGVQYAGQGLVGVALSGGGIRAATFSLGILQFLATKRLLKHVDYLSTVSGGGYIGSSLTWFLHNNLNGEAYDVGHAFPYGADSPKPSDPIIPNPRLEYLRHRGNYLMPGKGITLASGIAVVLRGAMLNLGVWVPLISVLFALILWPMQCWREPIAQWAQLLCWPPISGLVQLVLGSDCCGEPTGETQLVFASFFCALVLFAAGIFAFTIASAVYSVKSYRSSRDPAAQYDYRRNFEIAMGRVLVGLIAVPAILASLPILYQWIAINGAVGLIGGGTASGIWAFFKSKLSEKEKKESLISTELVAGVGAALLLYGFALLCYSIAINVHLSDSPVAGRLLAVAAAGAVVFGFFVNINLIGLHRFYRDRLMEAFLPDNDTATTQIAAKADVGMVQNLAERFCTAKGKEAPAGPYHLVNTNLIMIETDDRERKLRGGESFILSPLYCGSDVTGWRASSEYLQGSMSLATAMAISGAAANPDAGSGGSGPTRSPAVSILMSLLNIRLGYFVPHPDPEIAGSGFFANKPHHFYPGLTAAISSVVGFGSDEKRRWLQLSDGGHFDNTGLYELLRRKNKLIIACDGAADPDYLFADVLLALERARVDFGITWKVANETSFDKMVPSDPVGFPKDCKKASFGYCVMRVAYPDDPVPGLIIYMTTTLIENLGETVFGYRAANPAFPDQSTADQFFDERQFEAYRILGWSIAEQMAGRTGISERDTAGGKYIVVPRAA